MPDQTILTYQCVPDPNPLAVGENGEIRLEISAHSQAKEVNEIMVAIPCGKDAESIFQSASGTQIHTEEQDRWEFGRDELHEKDGTGAPAYFHIRTKKPGGDPMASPALFQISGKAAEEAGNAQISINTFFMDGTQESCSAYISKGTGELYLENFLAQNEKEQGFPTAVFGRKEPIRLSWNSNGDFFRLYASGAKEPLTETTDTTFTVEAGVEEDTTFILQAVKPSASSVCLYRTLAIHIRDASLESLEICKELKADGAVQAMFGEPSIVPLKNPEQYVDWMLVPETDGYIIGKMEFKNGVQGNGTLTVKECGEDAKKAYEVSDMAFQGKVLSADDRTAWDISKKASLCVPVRKDVMLSVSLRVSYISEKGNYDLSISFVPLGNGTAAELSETDAARSGRLRSP